MPEHRLASATLYRTPRLIDDTSLFSETHAHLFETILTEELTSSHWVSLRDLAVTTLGVKLEAVPRCQLVSKRCCRGFRFLRGPITIELFVSPVSWGVALHRWQYPR